MDETNLNYYELSPLEIGVFWYMKFHEISTGEGVTVEQCAERMGRDPKTVRRIWAQLEKRGLIVIQARQSAAGQKIAS